MLMLNNGYRRRWGDPDFGLIFLMEDGQRSCMHSKSSLPALNEGGRISLLSPYLPCLFLTSCLKLLVPLSALLSKFKSWNWSTGHSTKLTEFSRREAQVRGKPACPDGKHSPLVTWGTPGRHGGSCAWRFFPLRTSRIFIYSEPWQWAICWLD